MLLSLYFNGNKSRPRTYNFSVGVYFVFFTLTFTVVYFSEDITGGKTYICYQYIMK